MNMIRCIWNEYNKMHVSLYITCSLNYKALHVSVNLTTVNKLFFFVNDNILRFPSDTSKLVSGQISVTGTVKINFLSALHKKDQFYFHSYGLVELKNAWK